MSNNCNFSKEKVKGLHRFLECEKTSKLCAFQRYCETEKCCVNTDGWFLFCKTWEKNKSEIYPQYNKELKD